MALNSETSFNFINRVDLPKISGVVISAMGLLVLIGWVFGIEMFKSVIEGFEPMKIATAIGFIISGLVVFLSSKKEARKTKIANYLSFVLVLISSVSLAELITGFDLLKFILYPFTSLEKLKVPIPVSVCFFLLGWSFIGMNTKNLAYKKIAQFTLHLVTLIAFIALMGYLYSVPVFYKFSFVTSFAIHTAIGILILSISASLINKSFGLTGLFLGPSLGSTIARKFFPRLIVLVLIMGYLRIQAQRFNWVTNEYGIALFALSFIIIGLFLIMYSAREIDRQDSKRTQAEESEKKLQAAKIDLEVLAKRLMQQNAQLSNFAHITSHNLRSPVTNLSSLLHIYHDSTDEEDRKLIFTKFEKVIHHLDDTLNELVDALKIKEDSGKEREVIQFEAVFIKTREMLAGQVLNSQAKVHHDFSNAPTIEYQKQYLESIFLNLFSNAIKYRSNDRVPEIHFKTEVSNGEISVTITDNGLGIDLEKHGNKLFGLHKTFHRHAEAKGVGLFLTKLQVESMGGKILVQSEVNKGTTFKVIFNSIDV